MNTRSTLYRFPASALVAALASVLAAWAGPGSALAATAAVAENRPLAASPVLAAASASVVIAPTGKGSAPTALPVAPAASAATTAARPLPPGNAKAGRHDLATVALDVGRAPGAGAGDAGQAEFAFNQMVAELLARELLLQKIAVKRIPAGLTPPQRASAAAGSSLMVSVNHEALTGGQRARAAPFSGYSVAVSRRQDPALQPVALGCARQVASALLATGRNHSLLHTTPKAGDLLPWADKVLGVQAHDSLAVLTLPPVPALRLQLVVASNPSEGRHMQDPVWTRLQAVAVAKGLSRCLNDLTGA